MRLVRISFATLAAMLLVPAPAFAQAEKPVADVSAADIADAARSATIANPSFDNWSALGGILSRGGNHAIALQAYLRAAALDPTSAQGQNAIAIEYFFLKDSVKELEYYAKALQLDPQFIDALTNRASTYFDQEKWSLAENDYRAVISIAPQRAVLYVSLADVLDKAGDKKAALTEYLRATKIDGKSGLAWRALGRFQLTQERYKPALNAYGNAINVNGEDDGAFAGRAAVYVGLSNNDAAKRDYEMAIKLKPDSASHRNVYGAFLHDIENYDEAIAQLDEAIKLDSGYGDAFYNRGLAHKESDHHSKALTDFNALLKIAPEDSYGYMQKADVYRRMEDHLLAVEYLDYALKLNPELGYAYKLRSLSRKEIGDATGASADETEAKKRGLTFE